MVTTHKQYVIRRSSMDKHDVNSDRNCSCGQFKAAGWREENLNRYGRKTTAINSLE